MARVAVSSPEHLVDALLCGKHRTALQLQGSIGLEDREQSMRRNASSQQYGIKMQRQQKKFNAGTELLLNERHLQEGKEGTYGHRHSVSLRRCRCDPTGLSTSHLDVTSGLNLKRDLLRVSVF